jgi:perosamine synthetase
MTRIKQHSSLPSAQAFLLLSVPDLTGNEWKYLKEYLERNFVSSVGPFVGQYERPIADLPARAS